VDDDPITRLDIREMLEEYGYIVSGEAKNGEDAIELANRLKPDLIIMDVKMPLMNGVKATSIIRKMHDAAVLMLTAYSQLELVSEAKEAGVTAYLVKPITEEDLIPAVEIALGQKQKLDALKQELKRLEQSVEDRKRIERAKGKLMYELGLSEESAFKAIQSASMAHHISMIQLASTIIQTDPKQLPDLIRGR
jgi:response regulator NasT